MNTRKINPWKWQDPLGFSQAIEIVAATHVLRCAGQAAMSEDGKPMHVGDMRGQIVLAMNNIETVLKAAGYDWSNVVQLNYYTTDVQQFFAAYDAATNRLIRVGCQPASTLLGVASLALPELMVEIEATAMK
jgi:2-iminobutanoate/2-iminopropanoate deaminase